MRGKEETVKGVWGRARWDTVRKGLERQGSLLGCLKGPNREMKSRSRKEGERGRKQTETMQGRGSCAELESTAGADAVGWGPGGGSAESETETGDRGAGLGPRSPWAPQEWGVRCSQSPGSLHKWDSFATDLWKNRLLCAVLFFHSSLQPLKISLWLRMRAELPSSRGPSGWHRAPLTSHPSCDGARHSAACSCAYCQLQLGVSSSGCSRCERSRTVAQWLQAEGQVRPGWVVFTVC